ncbi:hypothetical protein ACEZ3G_01120 [Maribacter algicola]|uniref:Uncharacterized protein n=1 Tax=Meishania litoralis TaxID=3434685 RepID=A0ACC7LEV8_9FLAO
MVLTLLFVLGQTQGNAQALSQAAGKQSGRVPWLDDLYRTISKKNAEKEKNNPYSEIAKGSPYFDKDFKKGAVYYNANFIGTPYLRYDAYNDEIQIKKTSLSEEEYGALLKSNELYCIMDSKRIVYRSFNGSDGIEKGYLKNLVNSGKYFLFVRRVKRFQEGRTSVNSLAASVDSKFIDETGYYFGKENETEMLQKIVAGRRQVLGLFDAGDRAELKAFIRKNKLNLNAENDLMALFYYANTLKK